VLFGNYNVLLVLMFECVEWDVESTHSHVLVCIIINSLACVGVYNNQLTRMCWCL